MDLTLTEFVDVQEIFTNSNLGTVEVYPVEEDMHLSLRGYWRSEMGIGFSDNLGALFGFYPGEQMRGMLGKPLAKVELSADKATITFRFSDGCAQAFGVEGDCCSESWIEHLTLPDDYIGATISNVTEASMERTDDDSVNPKREPLWEGDDGREHECLKVYETRFVTERGEIVLEYRNSSNGYYGGYLVAKE